MMGPMAAFVHLLMSVVETMLSGLVTWLPTAVVLVGGAVIGLATPAPSLLVARTPCRARAP